MRWIITNDLEFFDGESSLLCPSEREVLEKLRKGERNLTVVAPYEPPPTLADLFYVEYKLPEGGILPSQLRRVIEERCKGGKECIEREEKKYIERKLGLKVLESKLTLEDLKGVPRAKELVKLIQKNEEDENCRFKAVLSMGVAGTGKSYLAKIIAGELGWLFVEFNLSKLFENASPVIALHSAFSYLESLGDRKILLWIDEIEKAFASLEGEEKRILGQLLTIINDLGTEEGYKVNALVYATANDVSVFYEKAPELLRAGRFDLLVFFDTPTREGGIEIFKYYCEKFGVEFDERDVSDFITRAMKTWKVEKSRYSAVEEGRIPYTPAEIMTLVKWAKRLGIPLKDPELREREKELFERVEPVVFYATEAVNKIRSIASAYKI